MGRRGNRRLASAYEGIRYDIYKFCEALNFTPTWQQRDLLDLVQGRERRIACKSGQGPGKTTVSCVIGLHRALQKEGTLVVVTAPTMRQCKDIWLAEARRIMKRADPWLQRIIDVQATKVVIAGQRDWGVTTMTASKEEAAQGFHEKNMAVIAEEASGIPTGIITQFKGTLSNPNSFFLMIGNPNTRDCEFFNCFNRDRGKWATLTFNAEETPASGWFDPQRNLDLAEEFGRDSDVYRIRVLGEFPHSDPKCVISSEDLEKVSGKQGMLRASTLSNFKGFGMDFARFGGDELTLYQRAGEAVIDWRKYVREEPSVLVQEAFRMQHNTGWTDEETLYIADAGGMGQGVMHLFYDAGKNLFEFHNGSSPRDAKKYGNKITEGWFKFARKVRKGIPCIPADNVLIQQLSSRQYFMDKKGRMVLESKDQYMKRGHDSPDRADGMILAFYDDASAAEGAVSSTMGRSSSPRRHVGITVRH